MVRSMLLPPTRRECVCLRAVTGCNLRPGLALQPAMNLSDNEVVTRVVAGETALFEIIMRRYNQRLFRIARAIVRSDDEAEDAVQQAYISAYTHLSQFAGQAQFATWLTRIAIHEALARTRQRVRRAEVDIEEQEQMNRLVSQSR